MRLFIEGTPEEFSDKHEELVKALSAQLQYVSPELSEHLEKALPNKEPALKFRAMEQLRRRTSAMYRDTLDAMLKDIGKVLDGEQVFQKSDTHERRFDRVEFQVPDPTGELRRSLEAKAADDLPPGPLNPIVKMPDGTVIKSMEEAIQWGVREALQKADLPTKKLTKKAAAYLNVTGSLYSCNECEHWSPGTPAGEKPNRCVLHYEGQGEFAPNGRCVEWHQGEPVPGRPGMPSERRGLTKKLSLYRENDYHTGFKCNRCKFWIEGGKCQRVAGDIELTATCKLWEVVYNVPVPIQKSLDGLIDEAVTIHDRIQKGEMVGPSVDPIIAECMERLHPGFLERIRNTEFKPFKRPDLSKGDKQVRSTPGEEGDDPDYTEEGEPIFNPEGETPTEENERIERDGPDDTEEEESTEKSGLAEHVNDVHTREGRAYARIKRVLKKKGYSDADFEEGGPLYGWSVNELLEIARPAI